MLYIELYDLSLISISIPGIPSFFPPSNGRHRESSRREGLLHTRIPDQWSVPQLVYSLLARWAAGPRVPDTDWEETGKTSADLSLISHAIAAFCTPPDIVACLGATPERLRLVDDCKYFHNGVQSPFRFDFLSVKDVMHKRSHRVFGRNAFCD